MINVSNEYKEVLNGNDRQFYAYAEITLKDGTVLNLDNSNILDMKIDDASTPNGQFTIGSAIINQLTLQINNLYDEFSDYDFTDAIIRPSVGLQLSETIETVHKGVFIADDPKAVGSIINLTALDNMSRFDRPFKDVAIAFPCTSGQLLSAVCTHCGVHLATVSFFNDDYIIEERPDDEAISCREIVSWVAGISVNFAKINNQGSLVLKWYDEIEETNYDGGRFDSDTPYSSGDNVDGGTFAFNDGDNIDGGNFTDLKKFHHIYSLYNKLDLAIDDVVITGVSVSDPVTAENKVLYGEVGYVISLEGNKLIQSEINAQFIAESVGQKIIGMRFRPFETTTRSDPTIETGDAIKVSDRKGNVYHSIVTNYTYQISKPCRISCEAESPLRNSSTRYSESTKAVVDARKEIEKKITAYDLAVQQLNDLVSHSFGVYKTAEELEDGSVIYYLHDKPTLEESTKIWKQTADAFAISTDGGQTYTSGFDAEGNAVFNVLSAIGINADWIRTGKLLSDDGATLIDMAYGVANSDNFSFIDNIQSGFPLIMPFNIDDSVSKINKVLLKYTQQKFRTYSKTASSGGSYNTTSGGGGSVSSTTGTEGGIIQPTDTKLTGSYSVDMSVVPHQVAGLGHYHSLQIPDHDHSFSIPNHTHSVSIGSHTHNLDFGIQEQAISNYAIDVYVDGVLRVQIPNSPENAQGIVDLTEWVTTVGWHEIEIRSTTLKRVSAQLNIKSYIRS